MRPFGNSERYRAAMRRRCCNVVRRYPADRIETGRMPPMDIVGQDR